MKKQLIGVYFKDSKDTDKEYLYWDTLGCKVGDVVVVEARDTIAIAKVSAIYVATSRENDRPIRNVVSKVESSYTKAQEAAKARAVRRAELWHRAAEMLHVCDIPTLFRAYAACNEEASEVLKEIEQLQEEEDAT